jgi:hypothetical protein
MPKIIGHHLSILTAKMAINGCFEPNIIRCNTEQEVLEKARQACEEDVDPTVDSVSQITVYDDGNISYHELMADEILE